MKVKHRSLFIQFTIVLFLICIIGEATSTEQTKEDNPKTYVTPENITKQVKTLTDNVVNDMIYITCKPCLKDNQSDL